ncbi:homoserine dehydrogenase [Eggerthellaceae bacterium zg-1084]|uniref:Homoserine dehydrogenase n=1 Tax=Berryella wangjianweii TaxID=2734634 RepID=A0A6M8JA13_9ACTN|nr:homoserine dehydrogenase [Berryella wangjianweii]NPD30872.1 homoserine dehydrogenase [Berryella wangjianweii]NPD31737.1 homoserine dehydrogenase [Eggerthellaceae bacterium zg-997]QKF07662.1 homoserine dehydrogenase [Berryella wangjianweii]
MAVKVGLIGTGTVGAGCLDILRNHHDDFAAHYGVDLEVVRVCSRQPDVARAYGYGDVFTPDYREVVNDPEVQLVVELIGGTDAAHDVVATALRNGKAVVTANKALMATAGEELFSLANESGVELAFEASVGGGIPIIGPLKHSLTANGISKVMGIVNGTTNYMLTQMDEHGVGYDEALRDAQQRGFAEADPSADVDGLDAAAKIAILSSIAFGSRVTLSDVHAEGIRNVSTTDLEAARDMGYCVKLLALGARTPEGIDVRVHPTMLPLSHQMAKVSGVFNAIYVVGDAVGETMFFGEGAGAGPAASAVMGDVIEVARHMVMGVTSFVGCTCTRSLPIVPMDDLETKYYIRFPVADRPGVLASMAGVFADFGVSIYSVVQRGKKEAGSVEVVYVTHTACERDIRAVVAQIASQDDVLRGEPSIIRVED